MATWTPCWKVSPEGEGIGKYQASRSERTVTVRQTNQTRGGQRYRDFNFDDQFGATPEEAIEKYIKAQEQEKHNAGQTIIYAEMQIESARGLLATRAWET